MVIRKARDEELSREKQKKHERRRRKKKNKEEKKKKGKRWASCVGHLATLGMTERHARSNRVALKTQVWVSTSLVWVHNTTKNSQYLIKN